MQKLRTIARKRLVIASLLALLIAGAGLAQRGMMGGSGGWGDGMMGGQGIYPSRDWSTAQQLIAGSGAGGSIDRETNTVTFTGTHITLDMIAGQPGKPDTTFEVAGLVDPTIEVPRGAVIDLELVNMDYGPDMAHGVVVTQIAPPYGRIPVPMMGFNGVPPLSARTGEALPSARYAVGRSTFRAVAPGTYYYLCQVPGHAQEGMYGTLIVQ